MSYNNNNSGYGVQPGYGNQNSFQNFQNSVQKLKEKPNNYIISNMVSAQKKGQPNFEDTDYFKTINKLTEKCYELKGAFEKQKEREKATLNDVQYLKDFEISTNQKIEQIITEVSRVASIGDSLNEKYNNLEYQMGEMRQIMNLCQQGIQDYSEFKNEFSQM